MNLSNRYPVKCVVVGTINITISKTIKHFLGISIQNDWSNLQLPSNIIRPSLAATILAFLASMSPYSLCVLPTINLPLESWMMMLIPKERLALKIATLGGVCFKIWNYIPRNHTPGNVISRNFILECFKSLICLALKIWGDIFLNS